MPKGRAITRRRFETILDKHGLNILLGSCNIRFRNNLYNYNNLLLDHKKTEHKSWWKCVNKLWYWWQTDSAVAFIKPKLIINMEMGRVFVPLMPDLIRWRSRHRSMNHRKIRSNKSFTYLCVVCGMRARSICVFGLFHVIPIHSFLCEAQVHHEVILTRCRAFAALRTRYIYLCVRHIS